ncbi:FERM/acyl-CoA-binding protein, 3-helical bundle [Phaffia rhodozyma]|uniref:FERM/acyl-CoA-binding protein, 3-helical bundle n=1 Tax=Phaffia rhodozyma TaxID=264483 RepID=A0A0F7SXT7_PHARH|nr:FERM/acyl-CoA-binding protein, 3-helical bundle [Phaffia rhodozyma]
MSTAPGDVSEVYPSQDIFIACSEYISSCPAAASLPVSTKLRLYGLFKLSTTHSPVPPTSRPSIWDLSGRSKWDAWEKVGKQYIGSGDVLDQSAEGRARQEYVQVGISLGFDPSLYKPASVKRDSVDLANLSDSSTPPGSPRGPKRAGMGVKVSTLSSTPAEQLDGQHGHEKGADEREPHRFVIERDIEGLKKWLNDESRVGDVNEFDTFGYTPLHLASDRNMLSAVNLLLLKGADPLIRDRAGSEGAERTGEEEEGMTALEMATINGPGWEETFRSLEQAERERAR